MKENNEPNAVTNSEAAANEPTLFAKVFFDIPRHNLITKTGMKFFSPKTMAKIEELLSPLNLDFAKFGGWADEIKKNIPPNDKETNDFLAEDRNKKFHRQWHYVNLPLGADSYAQAAEFKIFTRQDDEVKVADVVQVAKECVRVLRGKSPRFSQVNALRLICHLVGDIHQPLHIGCGYIDETDLNKPVFVKDPKTIKDKGFGSDSGGNAIKIPGAGTLHSYWDGGLGGEVGEDDLEFFSESNTITTENTAFDTELEAKLIEQLYQEIVAEKATALAVEKATHSNEIVAAENVQVEDLIEQWANDSLKIASAAYETFAIAERIVKIKPNGDTEITYKVSWEEKLKYNERCAPLLKKQLNLAVQHLAELLNKIWE